ncbi:MAG: ABC transporter permease [Spirochaetaceae bacterium]
MSTSSTADAVGTAVPAGTAGPGYTDGTHHELSAGRPSLSHRLYSVWLRHVRVYSKNLISNALPPFLEPLIFLVGLGLGLSRYIGVMEGLPYVEYLASGLMITAAMFTAAFECSFGTFIRLEFDKVYDGMLGAPITADNLLVGEILWAGTKGFVFSLSVLIVVGVFGILPVGRMLLAPFLGFLTGTMFAALGFLVTSWVKNINQFNFFFSGFISPMFFFSGVVFPVENLPTAVRPVTEILPLTHPVRVTRAFSTGEFDPILWWDLAYMILMTVGVGWYAIHRLRRKLIQ